MNVPLISGCAAEDGRRWLGPVLKQLERKLLWLSSLMIHSSHELLGRIGTG